MPEWESVDGSKVLLRKEVPGGWLYMYFMYQSQSPSICFVPYPKNNSTPD